MLVLRPRHFFVFHPQPFIELLEESLLHDGCMTEQNALSGFDRVIDDTGLVHLKGLAQLQYPDLNNAKVINEGMKKLRRQFLI